MKQSVLTIFWEGNRSRYGFGGAYCKLDGKKFLGCHYKGKNPFKYSLFASSSVMRERLSFAWWAISAAVVKLGLVPESVILGINHTNRVEQIPVSLTAVLRILRDFRVEYGVCVVLGLDTSKKTEIRLTWEGGED